MGCIAGGGPLGNGWAYEVWRICGRKGMRLEWRYPHSNRELYQVIAGAVRLVTPDETVIAGPGELLRIPPYCTHALEAQTKECGIAEMGRQIRLLNLLEDLRAMRHTGEALPEEPCRRSEWLQRYPCYATA